MTMRTPLARVRGLGASRGGLEHWRAQRLTALALIPLSLWFVGSLIALAGASHSQVVAWMHSPWVAALNVLFIVGFFHHAQLGVQVIIEDYVQDEFLKVTTLIGVKFLAVLLATVSSFAVVMVATGG